MGFFSNFFKSQRFNNEELGHIIFTGLKPLVDEWLEIFEKYERVDLVLDFMIDLPTLWHLNAFIIYIVEANDTVADETEHKFFIASIYGSLFKKYIPENFHVHNHIASKREEAINGISNNKNSDFMKYSFMVPTAAKIFWQIVTEPNEMQYTYDTQPLSVKGQIKIAKGGYRSFLKPELAKRYISLNN